ncbi:FeoC-like transcriptional regulator [Leeia sp.]|uniref:FeoC-like transcriptional regulator n=1 Tax=Leeia sp. TaxID=2884678 RepID=UPI0035B1EBA4
MMLLAAIRQSLQTHHALPLTQLAALHGLTVDRLLPLLEPWLQRGKLQLQPPPKASCSKGCGQCQSSSPCEDPRWAHWLG